MAQTETQPILGYWAIRGLAHAIRLVFYYTKTPFVDKLYEQGGPPDFSREKWLSEKENLDLDFPNLPYLIDNNLKITQSKAILYYLGRKFNLLGTTPEQEAKTIMLCEEGYDLHVRFAMFCYSSDGDSEIERKKFVETTLSNHLRKFDDYLGQKKTKFIVDDKPTIGDFQVYDCLDICFALDDANILAEKFIHIKNYLHDFSQLPELKDYIEKTVNELPLNAANAKFGAKVLEKQNYLN